MHLIGDKATDGSANAFGLCLEFSVKGLNAVLNGLVQQLEALIDLVTIAANHSSHVFELCLDFGVKGLYFVFNILIHLLEAII